MEMNEDGFLEELLALRRLEAWETNPAAIATEINSFFSTASTWGFDGLDSSTSVPPPPTPILPNSASYESFSSSSFTDFYHLSATTGGGASLISPDSSFPGPSPDYCPMAMAEEEAVAAALGHVHGTCKPEPAFSGEIPATPSFSMGMCMDHSTGGGGGNGSVKSKVKKVGGQPSKNLMAERRRRKRLNDRLSMLRSVVPKISKMDRTSILGDTIDYMKELLERINSLQEEIDVGNNGKGSNQLKEMSIFKDGKPNDVLVRNSPKFDVERRNMDTRVEICCAGKPGLLLSTVTTLEALGLEIQQCVISCFNDFSLQASCSEQMEQRTLISSEDMKQALFRNAGYGGRCL